MEDGNNDKDIGQKSEGTKATVVLFLYNIILHVIGSLFQITIQTTATPNGAMGETDLVTLKYYSNTRFFYGSTALVGQVLLIGEALRSHSDKLYSVGLL